MPAKSGFNEMSVLSGLSPMFGRFEMADGGGSRVAYHLVGGGPRNKVRYVRGKFRTIFIAFNLNYCVSSKIVYILILYISSYIQLDAKHYYIFIAIPNFIFVILCHK